MNSFAIRQLDAISLRARQQYTLNKKRKEKEMKEDNKRKGQKREGLVREDEEVI
jgi:hypothetical protein